MSYGFARRFSSQSLISFGWRMIGPITMSESASPRLTLTWITINGRSPVASAARCEHSRSRPAGLFSAPARRPRVSAPPESGHLGAARHPASGSLGVYLFLPFGLGSPLGWNDRCVKGMLPIAAMVCSSFRVFDLGRLATGSTRFSFRMARLMELLSRLGLRSHAKGTNWRRPCLRVP